MHFIAPEHGNPNGPKIPGEQSWLVEEAALALAIEWNSHSLSPKEHLETIAAALTDEILSG